MDSNKLLLIRWLQTVILILNAVLVGIGAGVCFSSIDLVKSKDVPPKYMAHESVSGCVSSSDIWLKKWGKNLVAQIFVFYSTCALSFFMLIRTCITLYDPVKCGWFSVISGVLCSINFCLEAWLTVGAPDAVATTTEVPGKKYLFVRYLYVDRYSKDYVLEWIKDPERTVYTRFYIQSWAAATFFYFVLAVLFAVDTYFACCGPQAPQVTVQDKRVDSSDPNVSSTKSTDAPVPNAPGPAIPSSIKRVDSKKGVSKSALLKMYPASVV